MYMVTWGKGYRALVHTHREARQLRDALTNDAWYKVHIYADETDEQDPSCPTAAT